VLNHGDVAAPFRKFETVRQLVAEIELGVLQPFEEARTSTSVYQAGPKSLSEILYAQRALKENMSAYYTAQVVYWRRPESSVVGREVIQ
jgi:hypothetical protein